MPPIQRNMPKNPIQERRNASIARRTDDDPAAVAAPDATGEEAVDRGARHAIATQGEAIAGIAHRVATLEEIIATRTELDAVGGRLTDLEARVAIIEFGGDEELDDSDTDADVGEPALPA